MDDFTKNKIAYTVVLLATIYTMNPLITDYGQHGFLLFDVKITLRHAFYSILALLGFATYCMALQFLSENPLSSIKKVSHASYALSLTIPLIFLITWAITLIANWFIPLSGKILPFIVNISVSALGGIAGVVIAVTIKNLIEIKDKISRKEQQRSIEIKGLLRAKNLYDQGNHDLALFESYKTIELALRQALADMIDTKSYASIRHLSQKAKETGLINDNEFREIEWLRQLRNKVAHGNKNVTESQARSALNLSDHFVKNLSFINKPTSYKWLVDNQEAALESLKVISQPMTDTTISHLWDAWINRDGAVEEEINGFFMTALMHNPALLINMFKNHFGQHKDWINQLERNLTNFVNDEKLDLKKTINIVFSKIKEIGVSSTDIKENLIVSSLKNRLLSLKIKNM